MGCSGSKQDSAVTQAPQKKGKDQKECDLADRGLTELPQVPLHVEKLDCSENQITVLPPAIGGLSHLQVLDCNGNKLTTLPVELASCASLVELLCYKNEIKELPKELNGTNLPALTTLNLFNNKLRKLPNELGTISTLTELNLAANKLMMLSDDIFLSWSAVKVLNLYDNNLVRLGSLEPLEQLTEIRLYGNNLEEMPKFGKGGKALEVMELHKNRVASTPEGYFAGLPELKRLVLNNNMLASLDGSICACSKLESLQVQENQLEALPEGEWPSTLSTLFLQDNKLTALPDGISGVASLTRVNLKGLPLAETGEGSETSKIQKKLMATPGAVFWSTDGRKWDSPA